MRVFFGFSNLYSLLLWSPVSNMKLLRTSLTVSDHRNPINLPCIDWSSWCKWRWILTACTALHSKLSFSVHPQDLVGGEEQPFDLQYPTFHGSENGEEAHTLLSTLHVLSHDLREVLAVSICTPFHHGIRIRHTNLRHKYHSQTANCRY